MSFLEELHKPDILDCISNLSSDEVFTPPRLANELLDTLPQELFSDPNTKFLDPCCKSGVFLREIAKRLIEGLKDEIPNLEERLNHIFKNQLYGLAITELTALLSRRSVYCSMDAGGEYSVSEFDNKYGNIEYETNYHSHWWPDKAKNCSFCGASKEQWNRESVLEQHAYSFIHTRDGNDLKHSKLFKRLKDMKFDVIIGNPPYQLSDGGGKGSSASPLYHLFVKQAKKLNPRYITMIIPSRWFSGGKGLDSFRDEMLHDNRIRSIYDFINTNDCFPGIRNIGGICYFLWDRDNPGLCKVTTNSNGNISVLERPLLEQGAETFIRHNSAISILRKVQIFNEESFENIVSTRKPFGFDSTFKGEDGEVKLHITNSVSTVKRQHVIKNGDWIDRYKVFVSKCGDQEGNPPFIVLTKPIMGFPNSCCTESYLVVGPFDSECIMKNVYKYICTRFFKFMLMLKKNTHNAPKSVYTHVPMQNFTTKSDIKWEEPINKIEEQLYKKYGLTEDEIAFIESMIRPME